jgi:hypothetical protein
MSLAPKKSMRPKPNPKNADKPMRPKRNPNYDMNSPKSVADRSTREMKKGGMVEGSAKDMREDKMLAKKHGMSMSEWEKSPQDKKHDAPKKMAAGGSVRGTGCAVRGKNFSGTY